MVKYEVYKEVKYVLDIVTHLTLMWRLLLIGFIFFYISFLLYFVKCIFNCVIWIMCSSKHPLLNVII